MGPGKGTGELREEIMASRNETNQGAKDLNVQTGDDVRVRDVPLDVKIEHWEEGILRRLEELKECLKIIQKALGDKAQAHMLTETLRQGQVDYIGELLGNTEFSRIVFQVPEILESSFFVTFYAFLENTLTALCEIVGRERNLILEVSDLQDRGIVGAQTYITKAAKLSFPDESTCWKDIYVYSKIRNCVVHRHGRVADKDKELPRGIMEFEKRGLLISLASGKQISLSEGFCFKFTEIMEGFLKEVFQRIIDKQDNS